MSVKFSFTAFLLGGFGVLFSGVLGAQSLSLKSYLDLQMQDNFSVWQREAQLKAQQLALEVGEEYWKPDITLVSGWQERRNDTSSTITKYDQWKAGIEARWTSDIGTSVTLETTYLDGEGLGSNVLAERQSSSEIKTTISQPLLKNNTPEFQRLTKYLAENEWRQFENDLRLSQLEVRRDSLSYFIDFQTAYENFLIQKELLTSLERTAFLVERMAVSEKATPHEVALVKAEVEEQKVNLESAAVEVELSQKEALQALKIDYDIDLKPFSSLVELSQNMEIITRENITQDETSHPEYIAAELSLQSSEFSYRQEENTLRPDLDVFYQYKHNSYEISPNNEDSVYGLRFSYLLTNKIVQQKKEALSATVDVNVLERARIAKQLSILTHSQRQRALYLDKKTQVLKMQVELAKRGLEQQRKRFQVGRASYYSLESIQQDVIDKQVDWLAALKSLALSLNQLSYYTQSDIRSVL